ncbi:MAG: NPCBM/NEW2 domain-containing protein [Planctomycetota bacterium]|nr:NPCBM/NEW2 domain-containing protein [Planctomycetota bacterium]
MTIYANQSMQGGSLLSARSARKSSPYVLRITYYVLLFSCGLVHGEPEPAYRSGLIKKGIIKHVDIDITGAEELHLVVRDGNNRNACDWADWAEPSLVGPQGEVKLTDIPWFYALAGWGNVNINKSTGGGPMRIDGKPVAFGIGTHAESIISYGIGGKGYTRFKVRLGADNGGTDQGGGRTTSLEFLIYTEDPELVLNVQEKHPPKQRPKSLDGPLTPKESVAALILPEGLEATIFAHEPVVQNPTNMDLDARGRVWITEGVNYRRWNNLRPEGDRILILEDTNGDGKADRNKVFYQGTDVNAALGICVVGHEIFVSASPSVIRFTDADDDDRPDKKEILFTGIGGEQHDRGVHAMVFGPDGKLYFNFGNEGRELRNRLNEPIVNLAGTCHGRLFRCDFDGSNVELLAHNFRNSFELCLDSFGNIWQADNDDDGNASTRLNYVMEHGNYGYADELTGASWRVERTGMHSEQAERHWHQNDPGVVPNFVHLGEGSPAGITFYEGNLLPEAFRNQVILCDPGTGAVLTFPVADEGAGFTSLMTPGSVNLPKGAALNLLSSHETWFRPVDVSVTDDGSVLIADWYDARVGGHFMADHDATKTRGRIYRITPKGHKLHSQEFNLNKISDCVRALRSPSQGIRAAAWQKLRGNESKAEDELIKLWEDNDPNIRSRALGLLLKLESEGKLESAKYLNSALRDSDPRIRIAAIRHARHHCKDIIPVISRLTKDTSAQVRRECAILLRGSTADEAPGLWAELAMQHDGIDRWYLEALGIGAEGNENRFFSAWLSDNGANLDSASARDIMWRMRANNIAEYLAHIITMAVKPEEALRYFRALDYQSPDERQNALATLLAVGVKKQEANEPVASTLISESLKRLNPEDFQSSSGLAQTLAKLLDVVLADSPESFLDLVERFQPQVKEEQLLDLAIKSPDAGVRSGAAGLLLRLGKAELLKSMLRGKEFIAAQTLATAIGQSRECLGRPVLIELIKNNDAAPAVCETAVEAVTMTKEGALELLKAISEINLTGTLRFRTAVALSNVPWLDVRETASRFFALEPAQDRPLPPLAKLLQMRGDWLNGKSAFARACSGCHTHGNMGREVGPPLSSIAARMGKNDIWKSILFPDDGVDQRFLSHRVVLKNGKTIHGLLISRTDQTLFVKTEGGVLQTFNAAEVESVRNEQISLKSAGIQKRMTVQELVDVVEFLATPDR